MYPETKTLPKQPYPAAEQRGWLIESSLDGRGFQWNGKTLLSGIDPAGRAERIASAVPVSDRTLYLCPSPLYGYGLERLLSRLACFSHSALLCVEAEPELFALAQEHLNPDLKNNPQLRLTNRREEGALCALLRKEWGPRFFRRVEMVRLNGGWQIHAELYDMLADSLRREITLDWINAMTLTKLGRRYIRNALRNLRLIPHCRPLGSLSFGGDPTLVLGAGPSLDKTLDLLQSHFGQALLNPAERPFRIICVDTCLSALKERNITPDMAVILESQHWNLEDFTGLSGWNIPAAMDLSALPRSADILSGELFLFFTPWTELNIFERMGAAGLLPTSLPPLGSVGLSAAAIARLLTSGTIITAGLDFSFTLDSSHARSTPEHKKRLRRHNRLRGLLNAEAAFGQAVFSALSKTGHRVFSNPSMRNYRDLFEREFGTNGDSAFFDMGNGESDSGLPLGIRSLPPESAFKALSGGKTITPNDRPPLDGTASINENAPASEKLPSFIRDEQNRLILLRDMLSGGSAMDNSALAGLVDECDYLWAHFPDYAAAGRRPSQAEFEAGSDAAISFLKRLRVEIDPFLKIYTLITKH
jgi:hypothetical protein